MKCGFEEGDNCVASAGSIRCGQAYRVEAGGPPSGSPAKHSEVTKKRV
jgi:hypothetical protein